MWSFSIGFRMLMTLKLTNVKFNQQKNNFSKCCLLRVNMSQNKKTQGYHNKNSKSKSQLTFIINNNNNNYNKNNNVMCQLTKTL
jgi:hypothetical protein